MALQIFGAISLSYLLVGCIFLAMQPLWQLRTALSLAEQAHENAGQRVPRAWIAIDMLSDFVLRWPLIMFDPGLALPDDDDDLNGTT